MEKYIEDQIKISSKTLEEFDDNINSHRARYGWYLNWLISHLKADYRYLDLGCRNGEFLVQLRERTDAWKLWGVDVHEESVMIAGDRGIASYCHDIHNLGFDNDFFDFVFMIHILEHTHNPTRVLWQAERVVKPGGKIFIEVPLEPKTDKIPTRWGHWYTFQNPQMLIDLIKSTKLEILKQKEDHKKKWFRLLLKKKE